MASLIDLTFNPALPAIMHLDLNSCFASVEQQANPLLRGQPIAVAAYALPNGCILAPSVEAKIYGIKTGMRVKEGRLLCPNLIILPSDPEKYRVVHLRFRKLLSDYTNEVIPKSIDEFILDLSDLLKSGIDLRQTAQEIKQRIKKEIGDWLRISVGIGPNRFLAKTAAGLHKPDGLDTVDITNYQSIYQSLELTDLCGIATQNAFRLQRVGITSVSEFATSDIQTLHSVFGSIAGYYWYLRLRGYEIDAVEFDRRSFGNSHALPKPFIAESDLMPILTKLVEKASHRMRKSGFATSGIHLSILYRDGSYWHKSMTIPEVFASNDIFHYTQILFRLCPHRKPVRNLAVSCFNLREQNNIQLVLFDDVLKKKKLIQAIDKIKRRYGGYTLAPALMLGTKDNVPDHISFGGIRDL